VKTTRSESPVEFRRRNLVPCALCGKGVMHDGSPIFYRVRVEQLVVDIGAVQRRHGLEQFFGGGGVGAELAQAMGADEPIAKPLSSIFEALLCQSCSMGGATVPRLCEQDDAETAAVDADSGGAEPA